MDVRAWGLIWWGSTAERLFMTLACQLARLLFLSPSITPRFLGGGGGEEERKEPLSPWFSKICST